MRRGRIAVRLSKPRTHGRVSLRGHLIFSGPLAPLLHHLRGLHNAVVGVTNARNYSCLLFVLDLDLGHLCEDQLVEYLPFECEVYLTSNLCCMARSSSSA